MPDINSTALTWLLYNLTEVVSSLTTMFTNVMSVFMEPPLVIFIGIAIFGFIVSIVGRLLHAKKR